MNTNHVRILEEMPQIRQWGEEYAIIYTNKDDEGKVFARRYASSNIEVEITDESIIDYFCEGFIRKIMYEKDDITAFFVEGTGSVLNSSALGFYYSPQDTPIWIDSEQAVKFENRTGEYLYYPMQPKDNGWVPDKSRLTEEQAKALKRYDLYTERIRENFYFYESFFG